MANKIIEQTVPRYKINGISTLTFCSTRAISKRQLVESTFNQPAFRTYSQSVRHGISAVLTLPAIFYHTIEFLADRRRLADLQKRKRGAYFVC